MLIKGVKVWLLLQNIKFPWFKIEFPGPSVLEYAAPVWASLPLYLDNLIESVQHKALRIIFPAIDYNSALYQSGLKTLNERRKEICTTLYLMYEVTVWSQYAPYSLHCKSPPWLSAIFWEYFPVPPQGEHWPSRELYHLQIRVETLEPMSMLAISVNNL